MRSFSAREIQAVFVYREDAARAYGREHGMIARGGWIFSSSGKRLARGWDALGRDLETRGAIYTVGGFWGIDRSVEVAHA